MCFVVILIYSCSKSSNGQEDKNLVLKEYLKNNGGLFKNQTVSFNNNGHTQVGTLAWEKSEVMVVNGFEYTTIPFSGLESNFVSNLAANNLASQSIPLPSESSLIIYKNEEGILQSKFRIRMFDTANHENIKIIEFYYNTTGNLKYTWLYKPSFNPVRLYVRDQSTLEITTNSVKSKLSDCTQFRFTTYNISCESQDAIQTTCTFFPVQNNYSICSGVSDQELLPSDPGGGGGAPTAPAKSTKTVQEIKNEMKDPCLNTVLSEVTDTKLKSLIALLFNSTFGGTPGNFTIKFVENPNLLTENGLFPAQARGYYVFSQDIWVIEMNPKFASISAKESLAAAMIHEIVHSFISLYKEFHGGQASSILTDFQAHTFMYKQWIDKMRDLLIEVYGMAPRNAVALACYGMADVLNKEGVPIKEINDFLIDKYKVSVKDCDEVGELYEQGTHGGKCK
jgi:hypothetical protein